MNSYQDQIIQADQHRFQLMREAEAHRLLSEAEQPCLTNRLLANVGEWMIAEGTRLKGKTADAPRKVLRTEF